MPCLPDNKNGSRIIVTSRFEAVGATCSPGRSNLLHSIKFLSEADSKDLFNQSVAESKSSKYIKEVPEEIEADSKDLSNRRVAEPRSSKSSKKVAEEIEADQNVTESRSSEGGKEVPEVVWKICGGLPLAIVTMAGLVACNPNKSEEDWKKNCKTLFPEPITTLSLDGVTRILDFCYNDMLGDLKTCSLYLSIFPKGSKINRKRLTRRWIAEGFVSEKQGLTEEEVAETYFNQLVRRKIIRPLEHSSNGKLKIFQVHDMVLEHILSKSSEENFITVVGGHWMLPAPSNKVRRLSMQSSSGNPTKRMNLSQVRSLTVFGSHSQLPFNSLNTGTIQVLDLDGCKDLKEKHLKGICNMLLLKYLGLRRTNVDKIPKKIDKLEYLETLDIRETNVEKLLKAVGQLKRINTILGGSKNPRKGLIWLPKENSSSRGTRRSKSQRKDGMKALRILSGIEIVGDSSAGEELHQLTALRKLAIYRLSIENGGETSEELRSAIGYLGNCGLHALAINDVGNDSGFINSLDAMSPPRYLVALELLGRLKTPPGWIDKLETLNKLTLSATVLQTKTFELLASLPALFSLTFSLDAERMDQETWDSIEKNKAEADGEIFVPTGFEKLKLLRFFAPHVPKLGFSYNAMPALEMIDMQFETFEGLFGIETLERLQEVHLTVNQQTEATEGKGPQVSNEINELLLVDLKDTAETLKVVIIK